MLRFNCESSTLPSYRCRSCNFSTFFLCNLKHHSVTNGSSKPTNINSPKYICSKHCTLETYSELFIKLHERKCRPKNANLFKCDECNYKAKRKETLQYHIRREHTNTQHGTKYMYDLERHDSVNHSTENKSFQCGLCSYKAQWNSNLKRHILCKHVNNDMLRWFMCNHCNYKCKLKTSLTLHIRYRHTKDGEINWFKCDQCFFKCKRRDILRDHILNKHTNPDKIRWFKCDHCPYKSRFKHKLKSHSKIHLFDENLQCDRCDGKFKNEENLNKHHLLEHSDVKLFKCELCSYKSLQKGNLKRHHINKHVDQGKINWFMCDHCNFKTKEKSALKRHILNKHTSDEKVNWFKCACCCYKSKHAVSLKRHINSIHCKLE